MFVTIPEVRHSIINNLLIGTFVQKLSKTGENSNQLKCSRCCSGYQESTTGKDRLGPMMFNHAHGFSTKGTRIEEVLEKGKRI